MRGPDAFNTFPILFERLLNGDGRYSVNVMVDGQRIHRAIGRNPQALRAGKWKEFIEKARADARAGRLNLPKGRKLVLGFHDAANQDLQRLAEDDGKDLAMKRVRLSLHLTPFLGETPLLKITSFDIERYKKHCKQEGAKPGTINHELAVLSHLLSKAIDWKWLDHSPTVIKRLV